MLTVTRKTAPAQQNPVVESMKFGAKIGAAIAGIIFVGGSVGVIAGKAMANSRYCEVAESEEELSKLATSTISDLAFYAFSGFALTSVAATAGDLFARVSRHCRSNP